MKELFVCHGLPVYTHLNIKITKCQYVCFYNKFRIYIETKQKYPCGKIDFWNSKQLLCFCAKFGKCIMHLLNKQHLFLTINTKPPRRNWGRGEYGSNTLMRSRWVFVLYSPMTSQDKAVLRFILHQLTNLSKNWPIWISNLSGLAHNREFINKWQFRF